MNTDGHKSVTKQHFLPSIRVNSRPFVVKKMNSFSLRILLILLLSIFLGASLRAETPGTVLTSEQISGMKTSLPEWELKDKHLERTIEFPSYLKLIEFVNTITSVAESLNHHPDMDIRYKKLKFYLSTHDLDGVSTLDVELAKKIDIALAQTTRK